MIRTPSTPSPRFLLPGLFATLIVFLSALPVAKAQNPPPGFSASCVPNPLFYQAGNTCRIGVGGKASGSIYVQANGNYITTLPLDSNGNANVSGMLSNFYPGGAYDMVLTYQPDSNSPYTQVSIDLAQTVYANKIVVTAETLTCSPQVLLAGNTATCTFHIPNPGERGNVTFSDGTNSKTVSLDSSQTATVTGMFAGVSAGTYKLSASYAGDTNLNPVSTTFAENVVSSKPLPLAMSVGCLPATVTLGASGSCNIQVDGGATGNVDLFVNGAKVASPALVGGSATVAGLFSSLPVGTVAVTATYNGDVNFASSTAGTSVAVASGESTTMMNVFCTPQGITVGGSTRCTAQLNPGATGTVQFRADGKPWAPPITLSSGSATTQAGFQQSPVGTHSITATYSGDGNFPAYTGGTSLNIASAPSAIATTTVSCSPGYVVVGQSTVCTAHVAGNATGGVILYIGDTLFQGVGLNSNGDAMFQGVLGGGNYSPGSYQIGAHYLGDINYDGHSGAATSVQVLSQPPVPNVTASVSPSVIQNDGQVALKVQVVPGATGQVTVSSSGQVLDILDLDSTGSASALLDFHGSSGNGVYPLTFRYSGDPNTAASSTTANLTVSPYGQAGPPPGSVIYSYSITQADGTSGYAANGNIIAYNDSVNGQWTASYDALNRIVAATQTPTSTTGANVDIQNFCWAYDSYGNRVLQARAPSPLGSPCAAATANGENYVQGTFNTANQLTAVYGEAVMAGNNNPNGWQVLSDASGNVKTDAVNNYWYDGDGRLCAAQNTTNGPLEAYIYDAEGNRVAKGTINPPANSDYCDLSTNHFTMTSEYLQGPNGEQLTEVIWGSNGSTPAHTNVFANGQLVATYAYNSAGTSTTLHFSLNDWLGTRRLQTDPAGNPEESCSGGSFGDDPDCIGLGGGNIGTNDATGPTETHFTGKERDTGSGLDYFGARYYGSSTGRWMSPDPINLTDERLLNPQTLNKYGYAANNPLKYVDDDGKDITIFYERPSLFPPSAGHILFTAENQQTGAAAVMSFGPIREGLSDTMHTLAGDSVVSTSEFGLAGATADSLRQQYASLTIQTTPEEAQQVIDWINQHGGVEALAGGYMLYDQNCTTVCRDALKTINKIAQGNNNWSPSSFWSTAFSQYANPYWQNNFGWTGSQTGVNYGNPRGGYDPFQLLQILSQPDNSSVTTSQGPGTPCGGSTGNPCQQ